MTEQRNDDLGRRFALGGEDELEAVIDRYGAQLFRYCYHVLCDYHAAEDVTQITLIKAYSARRSFTGQSALSTWLYRIAYHACIDWLRRRKPVLPLLAAERLPVQMDELDEPGQALMDAMGRLSAPERSVIYGRIVEERSYRELAQISGTSESALRKRYERAKGKLADALRAGTAPEHIEHTGRAEHETT